MEGDLASAYVRISPDLSAFKDELKAKLDAAMAGVDHRSVTIEADTTEARLAIAATQRELAGLGDGSIGITADPVAGFRDELRAKIEADLAGFVPDVTIKVGADTAEADAKLAATDVEAHALGDKRETIKVDADTAGARANLAATAVEAAAVGGGVDGIKAGADEASSGLSGLTSAALALTPALVPIAAVGAAGIASLLTPITAATAGIGAFGLIALPTIKNVATAYSSLQTAQTAYNTALAQGNVAGQTKALADMKGILDNLAPGVRDNVLAVQALWQEWQKLSNAMAPIVSDVLTSAVGDFKDLLGILQPVAQATGGALVDALHSVNTAFQQPDFKAFVRFVTAEAGPSIAFFNGLLQNLAGFLSKLAEAFAPLATVVEGDLLRMTAAWENWAGKLGQSAGFQQFIQYVEQNAPLVGHLIENLAEIIGRIAVAAAPIGTVILQALDPVLHFLDTLLSLNPFVTTALVGLGSLALAFVALKGPISAAVDGIGAFIIKTGVMSSGGFIGGMSGLAGLAAGFGALASAAAVAVPVVAALGVVLDTINTARKEAATPQGISQYLSGGPLHLGNALAEKPIGPAQDLQAIKDITAQMNQVRREQASLVREAGGMDTLFSSVGDAGAVKAFNDMTGAIQKYHDEINAARDARDHWISNDSKLSGSLGISKASVDQLAASLNINLGKALNPSDVTRMREALQLQASQAHITASAMDYLAQETHQSTTAITNAMNAAAAATQKAFASWSDPIAGVTQQMSLLATVSSSQQNAITTAQGLATAQTNLQQAQTAANTALAKSGATSSQYVSAQQAVVSAQQAVTSAASAQSSAVTASANAQSAALGTAAQATVPTAAAISGFYNRMKTEGNAFTANIQQAIKDGYDPTLINQILQAGPTQAGPLLQGLITNYSSSFKDLVNNGQKALKSIGDQAVEEARLMVTAVNAPNSATTANYSNAVALSEQKAAQGAKATVTSLANALGLGLYQTAIIANEYGIQLPKAIGANVGPTANAVGQMTDTIPAGLLSKIPDADRAAAELVGGVTATLGGHAQDFVQAGSDITNGVALGITAAKGSIFAAANKMITDLSTFFKSALKSHSPSQLMANEVGLPIAQGVALGIVQGSGAVHSAASTLVGGLADQFTALDFAPHGATLMDGFAQGLAGGFASKVAPILSSLNAPISSQFTQQITTKFAPALLSGPGTGQSSASSAIDSILQPTTAATGGVGTPTGDVHVHGGPVSIIIGDGHDSGKIKSTIKSALDQNNAELLQLIHANR